MALQRPALLALSNISKDFVLQLVCCAVGDPVGREELLRATGKPSTGLLCSQHTNKQERQPKTFTCPG